MGWGGSGAAGPRQLLPAAGPHAAPAGATGTSAAASHLAAHPPRRGRGHRPVPRSCGGARRETLAAKTAGTSVRGGVRGDRGTPLGGAKPARTRTLRPGPTCSARQALGQSVSEPGLASCRANAEAPLPFQFRPQETSRGSLSTDGKWVVAAGQAPFLPWRRRASTDSQWCWGPRPRRGSLPSSRARVGPHLLLKARFTGPRRAQGRAPQQSQSRARSVSLQCQVRALSLFPRRGALRVPAGCRGWVLWARLLREPCTAPRPALSLGHCRVLFP